MNGSNLSQWWQSTGMGVEPYAPGIVDDDVAAGAHQANAYGAIGQSIRPLTGAAGQVADKAAIVAGRDGYQYVYAVLHL